MSIEYSGFRIEGDGTFGMKVIKRIGAGVLPAMLQGMYTKAIDAKQDIDRYVFQKEEEDNKPEPVKKVKLEPRG